MQIRLMFDRRISKPLEVIKDSLGCSDIKLYYDTEEYSYHYSNMSETLLYK